MFYADLHVHSKYSRATSRECDLEHLAAWACRKGIAVLGTGDFTHPAWRGELKEKLVAAEAGLFRLRGELDRAVAAELAPSLRAPVRFVLQVEISTIYKKDGRTRKVHHVVFAPDWSAADRIVARLEEIGNLRADGRPILGLDSRDLLEIVLEAGEGCFLIPAHIWTPWFSLLGSQSGFDSVDECYGDLAGHVFALETGLSSDPPMNWRLSQLDRYSLVSCSDAHSPAKLGREACVFECAADYFSMREALRSREGFGGTLEFFPEEGKYHLDGHRKCGVCFSPEETAAHGSVCPVCNRALTVGTLNRVSALADRVPGTRPDRAAPFRSLVPLAEVLGEVLRVGAASKKVRAAWERLVNGVGPELPILLSAPLEDIGRCADGRLVEAIRRMRQGRVICQPGYDGEYGVIRLFAGTGDP